MIDRLTALALLGYAPNSDSLKKPRAVSPTNTGDQQSASTPSALTDELKLICIHLDTLHTRLRKQIESLTMPKDSENPSPAPTFDPSILKNASDVQLVDELLRRLNSGELIVDTPLIRELRRQKRSLENR